MFGNDGSGKTSILYRLMTDKFIETIPTKSKNIETFDKNSISFTIHDMGHSGSNEYKRRHELFDKMNCFIFVIDSTNKNVLNKSCDEYFEINHKKEFEYQNIPILVLANKQDFPNKNMMSIDDIEHHINQSKYFKNRKWTVILTSTLYGYGIKDAIQWIKENSRTITNN